METLRAQERIKLPKIVGTKSRDKSLKADRCRSPPEEKSEEQRKLHDLGNLNTSHTVVSR